MLTSTRFRFLAVAALLAAALPFTAPAQTPGWLQDRPFPFQFNYDYLRADAAALPDGGAWWVVPETHRRNYGTLELATARLQRLTATEAVRSQRLIEGNVSVQHLIAAPDGGLVLTGAYKDSVVFDARHRLAAASPFANEQYFVARLDSGGQVQWLRPLRDDDLGEVSGQGTPAFDAQGNLWVPSENYHDSYLTRFGPAGDSLQTIVQRRVRRATSLAVAPDGTIYAAGSCPDPGATFAGVPGPPPPSYTIYVACYAPTGQLQWVRYVEDVTCPAPQVATHDNGGVYFASYLFGPSAFGSITAAGPAWNSDFFLTRLDRATGTFQWLREVPQVMTGYAEPAAVQALTVDGAGNAWLLNQQVGNIQWSATQSTTTGSGASNGFGALLLAYDVLGNLRAATSTTGGFVRAHGVSIDPLTNRGVFTGLSVQAGGSFGQLALPGAVPGTPHPFVVSFDAALTPLGTPQEAAELAGISLFPNPAAAGGTLQVQGLPTGVSALALEDALGRVVARPVLATTGPAVAALTVPGALEAGLYVLRLQVGLRTVSRRVAISR